MHLLKSIHKIFVNIIVRPTKWLETSSLDPSSRQRETGVVFVADGTSGLSNFRYSFRLAYRTSGGLPALAPTSCVVIWYHGFLELKMI